MPSDALASPANRFALRRTIRSFRVAFAGIVFLVCTQPNFVVHLLAAVAALSLALALELSPVEVALVLLTIGLVLGAEAFNTALETLSDVVSPGLDPLIRKVKDVAAGGVLLTAVAAALVGATLFLPRLLKLLVEGR